MSPTRRPASHTLPRNFIFHYNDGLSPRTPELQKTGSPQPASPPRQPYRLRRHRAPRQLSSDYFGASVSRDVPIPTIEVSDPVIEDESVLPTVSIPLGQMSTGPSPPPRTPIAQIHASTPTQESMNFHEITETCSQGESISRPSTACSGFSDSSVSSSIESFPSLGTFTSPESDVFERRASEDKMDQRTLFPPATAIPYHLPNVLLSEPHKSKTTWTDEMDNHLWMTYMRYLQDPTHTPFKMLPGTAPPLGVCSRVVREAKRTWKSSRSSNVRRFAPWNAESPDTIKPTSSGSSTPTEARVGRTYGAWPRSDSSTRRRLRDLCKRKPTLSAHYNRLLSTRSPSPFLTSARSRSSSTQRELSQHLQPLQQTSSFSTRDMGVSLFATTSSAVSALNQFTEQSETPRQQCSEIVPSSSGRPSAHQKSQSLHLDSYHSSSSLLASPFQPIPSSSRTEEPPQPLSLITVMESTPRLASPMQIVAPIPQASLRLGKRRGESLLGNLGMNQTQGLESENSSVIPGISARRVRARGFSLGDVSESSRRLSRIFEPTIVTEPSNETGQIPPDTSSTSSLMPPFLPSSVRRLGSPFSEKPSRPHFNTFPRNFSLHGLEPTMESQEEKVNGPEFGSSSHLPLS
jgi:hypothetical protein